MIPDAMLVGVAQISDEVRTMDIDISMLKKGVAGLKVLKQFTVATDIEDLIDSGESFTTRGIFDDGMACDGKSNDSDKTIELAAEKSLNIRTKTLGQKQPQVALQHPSAADGNTPLKFEIYYNVQLQPYEFREDAAFVLEPLVGQRVSFIVRRKDNEQKRLGVFIRVNGENTLYRERLADSRSTVWIMEPNIKEFSVQGFQLSGAARQDFRVLSTADSQKLAFDYGRDVGMISVTMFQASKQSPRSPSEEELNLAVQAQAKFPEQTAPTRGRLAKSLTDQLLADSNRGLNDVGKTEASAIKEVVFQRDAIPIMSTSIRYFNAQTVR